jgi:hypothetical protein
MLRIEYTDELGNTHSRRWYYSEPLPEEYQRARVLKLTADGDELDLILDALRATVKPVTVIDDAQPGNELFVDMLLNPPEPNEAAKAAAVRYKKQIGNPDENPDS